MWLMSSEREEGTPSGSEEEEEFDDAGDTALVPAPAGEADVGIPKIPDWAEELLAALAAGERIEARDQPRLTYALDLRKEYAAAVQQRKAERAAAALQRQQAEAAAARQAKEAETKAAENATLLAVIEKQDKRLEALTSRLAAVEAGDSEDLEPSFREFCPRSKDNPFGGPGVLREGKDAEPNLRWYSTEVAFEYLRKRGGKEFHSFQALESGCEACFDILAQLEVLLPDVVKGINPKSVEDEEDPAYQAERDICKIYNSVNAVYHNILNSQLSYLQIEAILKEKHSKDSDNGWISTVLQAMHKSLHGLVGTPLPANLETKFTNTLNDMEERFSKQIVRVAAEQAARKTPRSPYQNFASQQSVGSTFVSRQKAATAAAKASGGGSGRRG